MVPPPVRQSKSVVQSVRGAYIAMVIPWRASVARQFADV
jgi:hypothetical protein